MRTKWKFDLIKASLLIVSLVAALTACGTFQSPAPSEAKYTGQFTPTTHADALISEGRFSEALRVVINEGKPLWLKKANAQLLFDFIEKSPQDPVVLEVTSLFETKASVNADTWAHGRKVMAQANAILKLAKRAGRTRSNWVEAFSKKADQYRSHWLGNIPRVLATCNRNDSASCLKGYPIKISRLPESERKALIASTTEKLSLEGNAIEAFSQYLETTEDLFSVLFKPGTAGLPIIEMKWISVGDFPEDNQIPSFIEGFVGSEKIGYEDFNLPQSRFSLFGVVTGDQARIKHQEREVVESEYLSSRQSRPNPRYQRLQLEAEQAQLEARQAQQALSNAQGAFAVGFYRGQAVGAQAKANRLYQQLRSTQPTLVDEVYSPYTYSKERYVVERNLDWKVYLVDRELGEVWEATASNKQLVRFAISQGVHSSDPAGNDDGGPNKAIEKIYNTESEISLKNMFGDERNFQELDEHNLANEIESVLVGLEKDNFVYLSASNFQSQPPAPVAPRDEYSAKSNQQVTGDFWLSEKSNDGSILMLSDGSVWEVSVVDRIYTMLWLPASEIMVVKSNYGSVLINKDDGEKASAVLVGYR